MNNKLFLLIITILLSFLLLISTTNKYVYDFYEIQVAADEDLPPQNLSIGQFII